MTEWRGHGPGPGCPCDSACESVDAALAAGPLGPGLARAGGPRLWGGQAGTSLANPQAGVPAATQRRASPAIAAAAAGSAPASAGPDGILPRRGYFTQVLSHGGLRLTGPPPLLAQAAFSVPQWLPVPAGQAVPRCTDGATGWHCRLMTGCPRPYQARRRPPVTVTVVDGHLVCPRGPGCSRADSDQVLVKPSSSGWSTDFAAAAWAWKPAAPKSRHGHTVTLAALPIRPCSDR